ncbi:MAG: hypothetical protein QXH81_05290 [Thermofilaceae archaeon]
MSDEAAPSAVKLVAPALLLAFIAAVALAQPSYVSQYFEVYDYANAGESYLKAVATAMESALEAVVGRGGSLARPCSGERYTVNVVRISGGEMGFTKYQLAVDAAGRVKDACIVWVNISTGLSETMLRATAYHEIVHVAQASYFRYASVPQARPWYIEASAEGFGSALSGVCVWTPYYFNYGLYRYNPYRFAGTDSRCYALGAFYYWILASGYSGLDQALRGSLSGESVVSSWVNNAYLDFLLALTKGVTLCGTRYEPDFTRVYLPGGTWSTTVTIDGLSAAYYRIELPAPGPILVTVTGNVRSNIALGQPFTVQNTSLSMVLANPGFESTTVGVTVHYRPPMEAKLVQGSYDGWRRVLQLTIHVLYAGRPVTGLIEVDGIPVEASNGYATFSLTGVSWGDHTLRISYAGAEAGLRVRVARPAASLATHPVLYLTPTGRGEIRLLLRNPGDVSVKAQVMLEAPLFIWSEPLWVDVPQKDSSTGLPFTVVSSPDPATLTASVCYAPGDCSRLQLNVTPVELKVLRAHYDSAANRTLVEALAEPVQLRLTAAIEGLWGVAWFKHSTYYTGGLNVSIPQPIIELHARPELVAPSWLTLHVNATVGVSDHCPIFNVSYLLQAVVNGVPLGVVTLSCGDARALSTIINVTYSGASLLLTGPFVNPVLVSVPRPALEVLSADWFLDDFGSTVRTEVAVKGPCKFLIMGREVVNDTLTIEKRLEKGVRALEIDLEFEELRIEMPRVVLELSIPPIALAGLPIQATVALRTIARVNATVSILVSGGEVERIHLVKLDGEAIERVFSLQLPHPGVYSVVAQAWFANASASLIYVKVRGIRVETPIFALVGSRAPVRVLLYAEPSVPLTVNVTVTGCGYPLELAVDVNSTMQLEFNRVCTAVVEARFLNYTSTAATHWDVLTLTFERVLGYHEGGLIVPNGTLKPVALFANATPAPAKATVNGQPVYTVSKPGGYLLKLEAELWGVRNETTLTVYAVPEQLYLSALGLLEKLGKPPYFASSLKLAVVSGRWETVKLFVDTYISARQASPEPVALLASMLAEKWAREGVETYLSSAQTLLALRPVIYAVIIVAAALLIRKRAIRVKARKGSITGDQPQPGNPEAPASAGSTA